MEKLQSLFKIAELIAKEKMGSLLASERNTLEQWLAESVKNKEIYNKLQNDDSIANELEELQKFDTNKAFEIVNRNIEAKNKPVRKTKPIFTYFKYAAAVALLAISTYLLITTSNKTETLQIAKSNISPGKQKAILITSNNQQIVLDSSAREYVIKEALAEIVNSGNMLSYNKSNAETVARQIEYNTLITPSGGEYSLVLSDGTLVMLNAGSKLKYPVVFNGNIREVELEGEAFFKVTKSLKAPFIVKANNVNVTVYGTVFNVMAYNNESLVQTTLVEGSVGVRINNRESNPESKIKPGEQFTFNNKTGDYETKEVNTDQYIAWTKGLFMFENEPIENILKVMSRWYNFEFEFKDDNLKKQRFTLSLGRYDDISKILEMLTMSSNVKFSVQGNKITIYSE